MLNLGDIRGIDGADCPAVDVITGGSPCQDLSIAGSRTGLSGERSGLFIEQLRIVAEMRAATHGMFPRYMVWENVPGALSSNHGKDFMEVLNGCARISKADAVPVPVPKDGRWPGAGMLYDDMGRWSLAWRVHDAQYRGVPQRRRRIALVCDFGGMSAPEVLFEPQGVPGDSDTGNPQGKRTADSAFGGIEESNQCWDAHESGLGAMVECAHTVKTTTREVICIGNGQDHVTHGYTVGISHPLNCMHDPMTILEPEPVIFDRAAFNQGVNAKFDFTASPGKTAPTLTAQGPGGVACPEAYRVRRLTPLECERLQGYPDGWTDIGTWTDSRGRVREASDSMRYRALGNSLALPFWRWLTRRLYDRLVANSHIPTLGSLFDGIGGFPRVWPGATVWVSEIDEFCCAVTRYRYEKGEI